jgi:hypothetical protein
MRYCLLPCRGEGSRRLLLLVLLLWGVLAGQLGHAAGLNNGGFELPAEAPRTLYRDERIDGWQVVSGNVSLVCASIPHPFEGDQVMHLAGDGLPGTIAQTVPTVIGQSYTLYLALTGEPNSLPVEKELRVVWDHQPAATLTVNTKTLSPSAPEWRAYTVSGLRATSSLTRVELVNLSGGGAGPMVDALVLAPMGLSGARPDIEVNPGKYLGWVGGTILAPTPQACPASALVEMDTTIWVRLRNAGYSADTLEVAVAGGDADWRVHLRPQHADQDVLPTPAGWRTRSLAVGETLLLGLVVHPSLSVAESAGCRVTLTVAATADPQALDRFTIDITSHRPPGRPDLMLGEADESLVGNNDYEEAAVVTQCWAGTTSGSTPVHCRLRVQNDGFTPDRLYLTTPPLPTGWRVCIADADSAGQDCTAAIVAGTYRTPLLLPGEHRDYDVEVRPLTGLPGGASVTVGLQAVSSLTPDRQDRGAVTVTKARCSNLQVQLTPPEWAFRNTAISLRASAVGGGTLEYQYRLGRPSGSGWQWQTLRTYALASTTLWQPTVPGPYTVAVYVRERGSTVPFDLYLTRSYLIRPSVAAVALTAAPPLYPLPGTPIVLTAHPTANVPVEYQFRLGLPSGDLWRWSVLRAYAPEPDYTWIPDSPGIKLLVVLARERGNTTSYDVYTAIRRQVSTPPITQVTLTAPTTGTLGVPLELRATSSNPQPVEYRFRVGVRASAGWNWTTLQEYSPSPSCRWTPTIPGQVCLIVHARAQGNTHTLVEASATQLCRSTPPNVRLPPRLSPCTSVTCAVTHRSIHDGGTDIELQPVLGELSRDFDESLIIDGLPEVAIGAEPIAAQDVFVLKR